MPRQRQNSHSFGSVRGSLLFLTLYLSFSFSIEKQFTLPKTVLAYAANTRDDKWQVTVSDLLALGDEALSKNQLQKSIDFYRKGIQHLPDPWSNGESREADAQLLNLPDDNALEAILSLHTNFATALSYIEGSTEQVLESYRKSCLCYQIYVRRNQDETIPQNIQSVATQSYFFLGMTYQDMASNAVLSDDGSSINAEKQMEYLQNSARAYAKATKLDPKHWSSFANMGVVLADVGVDANGNKAVSLEMYEEGIMAYQSAIDILTGDVDNEKKGDNDGPTDPPENKKEVIAELQYRIGLCLVPFLFQPISKHDVNNSEEDYNEKKCTLHTRMGAQPSVVTRSCFELAAYSFGNALQSYPRHQGANDALNLVTADATFGMSTDVKSVEKLFEGYAESFEYSLVEELRYTGFQRMRQGFDRALLKEGLDNIYNNKMFPVVLDAGCGTGLAGEVFRNISQTLIGVDLSPTIIEHAKVTRPGLYDKFQIGDITEIIRQFGKAGKRISLIVASDTFIYFNDLNDLFSSMASGLEVGGYAVFSMENVSNNNENSLNRVKPDWKWQITPSGRIAHRKEYVEKVAKAHSFDVVLYEKFDNFREEKRVGVRGHFFVLKKTEGKNNDEF